MTLCHPVLASRLPQGVLGSLLALSPTLQGCLRTLNTLKDNEDPKLPEHDKRYVDRVKFTARAGKGGNGCASCYQGASRGRHAVADGGNGGDGGNVVVRAVANMKSLAGVQQLYKAEAGLHGTKQRQHGRAGRDTVVLVPVGTVVQRLRQGEDDEGGEEQQADGPLRRNREAAGAAAARKGQQVGQQAERGAGRPGEAGEDEEPDELPEWIRRWRQPFTGADYDADGEPGDDFYGRSDDGSDCLDEELPDHDSSGGVQAPQPQPQQYQQYHVLADLVEAGQEVVVARGGAGGRGNAGMKARAHRPALAEAERGQAGEAARLLLELKLLADVGLVGVPNAGKSTLLRALTAATPRVGDYAFTTLAPQLGVVRAPTPLEEPLVVADIPGLIEGAHENRGLGHHFLRHIERTKAITYVLDCAAGGAGRGGHKPARQLQLLQDELAAYSPRLAELPALVVANKADLLRMPTRTLRALQRATKLPVVAVSARERATLLGWQDDEQVGKEAAQQAPGRRQRGESPAWLASLRPLHFRLAQLLHQAGARQQPPDWEAYRP